MSALGCCRVEQQPARLNERQRSARSAVGIASLGVALLAARGPGVLGGVAATCVGWFGVSHLVAARTGYSGCPELGAVASLLMRRDLHVGCVPWKIADRRLRLIG